MRKFRFVVVGLPVVLLSTLLVSSLAQAAATINNGSFETGDYTGWTLFEDSVPGAGTWGIATNGQTVNPGDSTFDFFDGVPVVQTSPGLPITYAASDGNFLAYQLQNGPGRHRMYQDITLSSCATTLTWDMQYTDHSGSFGPSQYLAVHIRDLSDGILLTLFITTEGTDPQSIPMTSFSADISPYQGSTVRLDVDLNNLAFYFDAAFDNFAISPATCEIEIEIDIKPGSDPNSINLKGKGKGLIPVAILSTDDFDATTVDGSTITFEGASSAHRRGHLEDVDGDGDLDWVGHFKTSETGLTAGDAEGELSGQTLSGTPIHGSDSVRTVPAS